MTARKIASGIYNSNEVTDTYFCRGMGVAISNLYSETGDERLCKMVAAGMKFPDFVGIGLGRHDINNLRKALR